jgi:hypothetical protein
MQLKIDGGISPLPSTAGRPGLTAEPDFEHRHIDARAPKLIERRERVVFEERQRGVGAYRIDLLEGADEALIRGLDAVNADALVVATKMRGGEPAAAHASGAQHRVDPGHRRTLAVGAAHGDHATWR